MSFSVLILPEARQDIQQAIDWYEAQKQGLDRQYFLAVVRMVKRIARNPQLFQIKYRSVRLAPLKKFPFALHYTLMEDKKTLAIVAVLHTSRNPMIWEDRS